MHNISFINCIFKCIKYSEYLLNDMVIQIKSKLENYWNNIMDDNLKVLAFFDPRYKNLCFPGMEINSILEFIRKKLPLVSQISTQTSGNKSQMSHFISRLSNNQNISNISTNQKDEISNYWNYARASNDISLLDWWKAHEVEYPSLSKLAQDF